MERVVRRALGALLGFVVRLWLFTLRLTFIVDPALVSRAWPSRAGLREEGRAVDAPWVLALWHGQQMTLLRWPRRRPVAVLVSLSRDGELLSGALGALGYGVERGSSSRGGARGLRALVRRMRAGHDAAVAVDGPKGPWRVVRREGARAGAAAAAKMTGGVVVPMAAACASSWVLSRTWDRFEIPRPFSRVAVVLGPPLSPEEATPEALAAAIERTRASAEAAVADAIAGVVERTRAPVEATLAEVPPRGPALPRHAAPGTEPPAMGR